MRAVTVSPWAEPPAPKPVAPQASVFDKALEFRERWTKHRTLLPPEMDSRGKCLVWYSDFIVLFEPDGFRVGKKSEFATDEILTEAIALAADIHNNHKKPYGD